MLCYWHVTDISVFYWHANGIYIHYRYVDNMYSTSRHVNGIVIDNRHVNGIGAPAAHFLRPLLRAPEPSLGGIAGRVEVKPGRRPNSSTARRVGQLT